MTPVYASDPDAAPDSEFEPGGLRHLVPGNRGRLLDARRTPIAITAVAPDHGAFELEIGAFEDAGARWELPLEEVGRFQFARDAQLADAAAAAELERAVARFDRALSIDCDPSARAETLKRVAASRAEFREWLAGQDVAGLDIARCIERRSGEARLFGLLEDVMAAQDVAELEQHFSRAFVSNPRSGEVVKGHAIVLAELGLCPYRGKIARDPGLFDEAWSRGSRARHLVARLAFTQALWNVLGQEDVVLYRGAATGGPLPEPAPSSFVSATLASEVAMSHFEGGPDTQTAVLWRQRVPVARLLMSFLETRAMNERFREAEAVLIAEPGNRAF
jgi:tetratricopeptide (TPR) repeat protein